MHDLFQSRQQGQVINSWPKGKASCSIVVISIILIIQRVQIGEKQTGRRCSTYCKWIDSLSQSFSAGVP